MNKEKRETVYNKCAGRCAYCGSLLDNKWQVDHVISKCYWFYYNKTNPLGVDDIDNLLPACRKCNHYKRSHCLESNGSHLGFRDYMLSFHKRLAKLPKNTTVSRTQKRKEYMQDIADRYSITVDKPFSGIFYFETLDPTRLLKIVAKNPITGYSL